MVTGLTSRLSFNKIIQYLNNDTWFVLQPQLKPPASLLPMRLLVNPGHTAPAPVPAGHSLEGRSQPAAEVTGGGEEHHQPVPTGYS